VHAQKAFSIGDILQAQIYFDVRLEREKAVDDEWMIAFHDHAARVENSMDFA
jgi:hypothetical protein